MSERRTTTSTGRPRVPGATRRGAMRVQEIMSRPVIACHPDDPLSRAAQLMWEHDVGAIPALDHEQRLVGIVTDRDVAMAAYLRGLPLEALPVEETMATHLVVCAPTATLDDAERLMRLNKVRRLPVVDDGKHPVGVVSLNDVARATARGDKEDVLNRTLVKTLAAVSEPRRRPAVSK